MKRILLPLLILSVFAASMSAQRGNNIDARKLQLALYAISNLYVDSTSETKLVEDAIVGMLEKLDPHSTYTDPEETKEMTEPLQGNFDGIGIQFNMLTDPGNSRRAFGKGRPDGWRPHHHGGRHADCRRQDEEYGCDETPARSEEYGSAGKGPARRSARPDRVQDHTWKDSGIQPGCRLHGG